MSKKSIKKGRCQTCLSYNLSGLQHQIKGASPGEQQKRDAHQRIFHLKTPLSGSSHRDPARMAGFGGEIAR